MKRTAERALSISAIILNILGGLFLSFIVIWGQTGISEEELAQYLIEDSVNDLSYTQQDIQTEIEMASSFSNFLVMFGWFLVILTIVAIILGIIGVIKVKNNAKTASIMFFIAAVLSGIITIQGILFIIAGILSIVRKPKNAVELT